MPRLKIRWNAHLGDPQLLVFGDENVEAVSFSDALISTGTSITTKLDSLNCKYMVDSLVFFNVGQPITLSPDDYLRFLETLNAMVDLPTIGAMISTPTFMRRVAMSSLARFTTLPRQCRIHNHVLMAVAFGGVLS